MDEAGGAEFPKTLYRDGGDTLLWGLPITERTVRDAAEEQDHLADGWRLQPLPEAGAVAPKASNGDLEAAAQLLSELETECDGLKARVTALEGENTDLRTRLAAFDHDGDGKPGGAAPADLTEARTRYTAATGKKPFHGWDVAELDRRAAEKEPA